MTQQPTKIILGIDPGTIVTGYGIISLLGSKIKALDFGCIRPKSKKLSFRYRYIFEGLLELCEKYLPTAVAVEEQFVQKNVNSALKLGMAKGACLIAATLKDIPVYGYLPSQAKSALVGSGKASKEQVQSMCRHLLSLPNNPEPQDAADALAIAICHAHTLRCPLKKEPL